MKTLFAVVAAFAALLIIVLAGATFVFLSLLPLDTSALDCRDMGDAVQVNVSETSCYMNNSSYEVNSTYTTIILDLTRDGNASSASDGVIVGPQAATRYRVSATSPATVPAGL